jgi:hypothetical protein
MATLASGYITAGEFELVSVEKIDPPVGLEGDDWYRYVIERAETRIVGTRRGTAQEVSVHARDYAADLNVNVGRFGRTWSSSRTKK